MIHTTKLFKCSGCEIEVDIVIDPAYPEDPQIGEAHMLFHRDELAPLKIDEEDVRVQILHGPILDAIQADVTEHAGELFEQAQQDAEDNVSPPADDYDYDWMGPVGR